MAGRAERCTRCLQGRSLRMLTSMPLVRQSRTPWSPGTCGGAFPRARSGKPTWRNFSSRQGGRRPSNIFRSSRQSTRCCCRRTGKRGCRSISSGSPAADGDTRSFRSRRREIFSFPRQGRSEARILTLRRAPRCGMPSIRSGCTLAGISARCICAGAGAI